jgi:hypothetical protein
MQGACPTFAGSSSVPKRGIEANEIQALSGLSLGGSPDSEASVRAEARLFVTFTTKTFKPAGFRNKDNKRLRSEYRSKNPILGRL